MSLGRRRTRKEIFVTANSPIVIGARPTGLTMADVPAQSGVGARIVDEATGRALADRDHAAFSAMVYAGLRIEETVALTLEDLSFSRGAEEVRGARGKGNKERVVPMSRKLGKSLRRYLGVRDKLVPAGEAPPPTSS